MNSFKNSFSVPKVPPNSGTLNGIGCSEIRKEMGRSPSEIGVESTENAMLTVGMCSVYKYLSFPELKSR